MAARQFTAKMSVNMTPAQKAAAQAARKAAGYDNDNQMFHEFLARLCAEQGIPWPQVDYPTEGPNYRRGKAGKFVSKT